MVVVGSSVPPRHARCMSKWRWLGSGHAAARPATAPLLRYLGCLFRRKESRRYCHRRSSAVLLLSRLGAFFGLAVSPARKAESQHEAIKYYCCTVALPLFCATYFSRNCSVVSKLLRPTTWGIVFLCNVQQCELFDVDIQQPMLGFPIFPLE